LRHKPRYSDHGTARKRHGEESSHAPGLDRTRGVPQREVNEWKQALVLFLKKLTWKYGKPPLLKSPPHTCRIKLLLSLFPEARFVHIHRNPWTVYQSTRHTLSRVLRLTRLQGGSGYDAEGSVLGRYREMYDVFFEERGLIPEGRSCEVGFEALESDPIGTVRGVYEALGCPTSAWWNPT
jgi:hypothetical protein